MSTYTGIGVLFNGNTLNTFTEDKTFLTNILIIKQTLIYQKPI